jgi:hypothetical protein
MSDKQSGDSRAETRTTVLTIGDDGIVRVELKQDADVTLEDAIENHEETLKLVGDHEYLVLVDIRPARSITREARMSFADRDSRRNTIAQALVIDSGISRVIGNFFIGLNKPPFPVKLFKSSDEAAAWLKGFLK